MTTYAYRTTTKTDALNEWGMKGWRVVAAVSVGSYGQMWTLEREVLQDAPQDAPPPPAPRDITTKDVERILYDHWPVPGSGPVVFCRCDADFVDHTMLRIHVAAMVASRLADKKEPS